MADVLLIPNEGEISLANIVGGNPDYSRVFEVALIKANFTLDDDTTWSSLESDEADYEGYERITVGDESDSPDVEWDEVTTEDGKARLIAATNVEFTKDDDGEGGEGTTNDIYGHALIVSTDGEGGAHKVVSVVKYDEAVAMDTVGKKIRFKPGLDHFDPDPIAPE